MVRGAKQKAANIYRNHFNLTNTTTLCGKLVGDKTFLKTSFLHGSGIEWDVSAEGKAHALDAGFYNTHLVPEGKAHALVCDTRRKAFRKACPCPRAFERRAHDLTLHRVSIKEF